MDQISSKLHSSHTVNISSRTSVQSEPVLSSDGVPSVKYKPVLLYPEKADFHENEVFSLEEDKISAQDISGSLEDDKTIQKGVLSEKQGVNDSDNSVLSTEERKETDEILISTIAEKKRDTDVVSAGKEEQNKLPGEPKAKLKWRSIGDESVGQESETVEKTKALECGFCEQDQVNPKLLPCYHSFCRECLEKLVCVRNGRHWLRCHLCKKKVTLSSNGVNGLENNSYLQFSNASSQMYVNVCGCCQQQVPTCRCSDCQTDLCTDCVGTHLTELPDIDHSIKNLKERNAAKIILGDVCDVHKPSTIEMFCNTCSEPICGKCAINKHLNHVTEDIAINANEKRKTLTGMLNDTVTRRLLRNLRENLVANRKEKARLVLEINKITSEIKLHMEKLKADIDKMGMKLIAELKGNEEIWMSSLDRKFQEAESRQRSADQILTIARRITDGAKDVDFVRKHGQLKAAIQYVKKISQPALLSFNFQFIPLSKPGLFGRVKMSTSLKRPIEFYDVGKASFPKRIYCICPTADSRAWVGYGTTLQLCQKDGKPGFKIDLDDMVIGIAENSHETVFVACKTAMKVIGSKMTSKTCFHLPHEPSSIAFNEDDNLIICYKDARRVSIHSTKGKVLKELDVRHFGYRFGARITDPWRVAINENQDILVADYSSENVAIFDSTGEIKSSFRCNVFRRAMICCDQGLVYIADQRKDQIQVFSETGQMLQTVRADGISGLWSMNIDSNGNLWLGSLQGTVKIYGRK